MSTTTNTTSTSTLDGWASYTVYVRFGAVRPQIPTEVTSALDLLGLSLPTSKQAIKAAYRRLARQRHPDAGGSEAAMKELNAAHDLLMAIIRQAEGGP